MLFKDRAKIGMEALAKSKPTTYEQKKEQVQRVLARSSANNKKKEKYEGNVE